MEALVLIIGAGMLYVWGEQLSQPDQGHDTAALVFYVIAMLIAIGIFLYVLVSTLWEYTT
jgi:hypothetical protein